MDLGITGISPIGLGLGTSSFSDYSGYMPSSMGLPGTGGYGSGMGTDGMLGMGNLGMGGMMGGLMEYQMYMQKLQNQLDLENLNHTNAMHTGMVQNQVKAHEETLTGIVEQLTTDAAVQSRIMTMYDKIREGDQKGVMQEYDKLKDRVYETFDKEIAAKGISIGRADEARRIIEMIYGNIVSSTAPDGQTHTLSGDIERYCDNAFMSGIVGGFRGQGNRNYKDETINHIYGKRIDNYESKQYQRKLGKLVGTIGSGFRDIGEGIVIGGGTYAAGLSAAAVITKLAGGHPIQNWNWKFLGKGVGVAALVGTALVLGSDIYKRVTRDKSNS